MLDLPKKTCSIVFIYLCYCLSLIIRSFFINDRLLVFNNL